MTWPSALVQWQYNLCQPALRTSGEIKINVPAVLFKIKTCLQNLSSFHIDLLGSMATECPPVATNWSTCPSGPCCQVLWIIFWNLETSLPGSRLLHPPSWHWPCPPTFAPWFQVLLLVIWNLSSSLGRVSDPGSNCSYQMKTTPGSQIIVTFLDFDLLPTLESVGCAKQAVSIGESFHTSTSLLLQKKTFCGRQVPFTFKTWSQWSPGA